MKKTSMTLCRFFQFTGVMLALASSPCQAKALADRLVLEVDTTSYSQRQFELYMALRSALYVEDPSKVVIVDGKNWAEQLELFRLDMLVEQEAQRLSAAPPGKRIVDAGMEVLTRKIGRQPRLKKYLERMDASDATIRRTLMSILRVKSFLVSRERQYGADLSRVEEKVEVDRKADWFQRLEQRTPHRLFEGARHHEAITPQPPSKANGQRT